MRLSLDNSKFYSTLGDLLTNSANKMNKSLYNTVYSKTIAIFITSIFYEKHTKGFEK